MHDDLVLLAGKNALALIRDKGLTPAMIGAVAGAAGGPKWLVLNSLDRAIFGSWFNERRDPLFLLGSSIGAWRFSAVAQSDPNAGVDALQEAYLKQSYLSPPDIDNISNVAEATLAAFLDGGAVQQILNHPYLRVSIMTVRCHALLHSDQPLLLSVGLSAAYGLNLLNRKLLGLLCGRSLFYDPRTPPPFLKLRGFPLQTQALTQENYAKALLASGSIPLVMKGIKNIPGAKAGVYRDGGMVDYHMDLPLLGKDPDHNSLILFPHYTNKVIPGWLDKHLPWRKPRNLDNALIVAPSPGFVAKLPHGRIPDRNDFNRFAGKDLERRAYWEQVLRQCADLGSTFLELAESGAVSERVQPL